MFADWPRVRKMTLSLFDSLVFVTHAGKLHLTFESPGFEPVRKAPAV